MAFHRIQKYSRQVVSQDCILSCQPSTIEEIPLLKRAQVSELSLRNSKAVSHSSSRQNEVLKNTVAHAHGEGSPLLQRDLQVSGMLMCWHLWNSRSVPSSTPKKKQTKGNVSTGGQRRTVTAKRDKMCHSFLTLRGQALYMAIEKYLLFLMPREMKKERCINHLVDELRCRRDRLRLSVFYVHTALGVCQYTIRKRCRESSVFDTDTLCTPLLHMQSSKAERDEQSGLAFSPERVFFPKIEKIVSLYPSLIKQDILSLHCTPARPLTLKEVQNKENQFSLYRTFSENESQIQDLFRSELSNQKRYNYAHNHLRTSLHRNLSLYCSSVLNSPEIQDIAQSGLVTLEGSLTLELF